MRRNRTGWRGPYGDWLTPDEVAVDCKAAALTNGRAQVLPAAMGYGSGYVPRPDTIEQFRRQSLTASARRPGR